jgi:hypothetical protein
VLNHEVFDLGVVIYCSIFQTLEESCGFANYYVLFTNDFLIVCEKKPNVASSIWAEYKKLFYF